MALDAHQMPVSVLVHDRLEEVEVKLAEGCLAEATVPDQRKPFVDHLDGVDQHVQLEVVDLLEIVQVPNPDGVVACR